MEDAGLIMQPSIFVNGSFREVPMMLGWLNSQSFPKASRIDKKLDQAAGAKREAIDEWEGGGFAGGKFANSAKANSQATENGYTGVGPITKAVTPLAQAWEGHRYGGQILKNCLEPIIVCQKPWEGKRLDSIVETGAGSLWIDGGRVGANASDANYRDSSEHEVNEDGWFGPGVKRPMETWAKGRWPPNFALCHVPPHICATCDGDGCDECNDTGLVGGCRRVGTKRVKGTGTAVKCNLPDEGAGQQIDIKARTQRGLDATYANADGTEEVTAWHCCESCAARRLGEQSGISSERLRTLHHKSASGFVDNGTEYETITHGGTGTCARFFPQFGWAAEIAERLAAADQVFYASKASRGEREAGLDALPLHGPNEVYGDGMSTATKCDPELHTPEGVSKRPGRRNNHPTVKNIALCRWLATLLLPPPEYALRRILVPFCGVASEMISAVLAGWDFVQGVEMSEEYCKIGEARLKFWSQFDSYEAAMDAARNIQRSHRRQDAQVKSGQLELSL
jgi:hypothetical protein